MACRRSWSKDGNAEIRTISVARDLGTQVQVDAGLSAGERVILNPPMTLVDGSKVKPHPDATTPRT
jgi:hypothetical protein